MDSSKEKILYHKKLSLLRIITNSTPSVVVIIMILVLLPQYFFESFYNSDIVFEITVILIGLLVFLIFHIISEKKGSYFFITPQDIHYHRFNRPNKLDKIAIKNVSKITIESLNVVIYGKDKERLVLDYLANPKVAKKEIEECLKDATVK
ncbi:MAG: hypothetical protein VB122_02200 [Erysipelotrichales bacterium]|nr:hypothetical protein [Erysipelotrichales bacterium]